MGGSHAPVLAATFLAAPSWHAQLRGKANYTNEALHGSGGEHTSKSKAGTKAKSKGRGKGRASIRERAINERVADKKRLQVDTPKYVRKRITLGTYAKVHMSGTAARKVLFSQTMGVSTIKEGVRGMVPQPKTAHTARRPRPTHHKQSKPSTADPSPRTESKAGSKQGSKHSSRASSRLASTSRPSSRQHRPASRPSSRPVFNPPTPPVPSQLSSRASRRACPKGNKGKPHPMAHSRPPTAALEAAAAAADQANAPSIAELQRMDLNVVSQVGFEDDHHQWLSKRIHERWLASGHWTKERDRMPTVAFAKAMQGRGMRGLAKLFATTDNASSRAQQHEPKAAATSRTRPLCSPRSYRETIDHADYDYGSFRMRPKRSKREMQRAMERVLVPSLANERHYGVPSFTAYPYINSVHPDMPAFCAGRPEELDEDAMEEELRRRRLERPKTPRSKWDYEGVAGLDESTKWQAVMTCMSNMHLKPHQKPFLKEFMHIFHNLYNEVFEVFIAFCAMDSNRSCAIDRMNIYCWTLFTQCIKLHNLKTQQHLASMFHEIDSETAVSEEQALMLASMIAEADSEARAYKTLAEEVRLEDDDTASSERRSVNEASYEEKVHQTLGAIKAREAADTEVDQANNRVFDLWEFCKALITLAEDYGDHDKHASPPEMLVQFWVGTVMRLTQDKVKHDTIREMMRAGKLIKARMKTEGRLLYMLYTYYARRGPGNGADDIDTTEIDFFLMELELMGPNLTWRLTKLLSAMSQDPNDVVKGGDFNKFEWSEFLEFIVRVADSKFAGGQPSSVDEVELHRRFSLLLQHVMGMVDHPVVRKYVSKYGGLP